LSETAGKVFLVGAGPGDPGLVTVRALELLARADVVLYDRLIPDGILGAVADGAELVYVGKTPDRPGISQSQIEELLIAHARAGHQVVRLKGGDPFVFGRGGEEAEALAEAGVPFEVVPAVTAGVAATAYAGIPVTHRGLASAVAFVTGRPGNANDGIDWDALARFPGTLVFYMGVRELPVIAERLIAAGRDGGEPAAAVRRGSWPDQQVVEASLADLPARVAGAGLEAPAIIVVGPVVELRERIAWFENRPLVGSRVVVTRARAQASGLVDRLRGLGAEVVEAPTIRIEPSIDSAEVAAAVDGLAVGGYDYVLLTSQNAVRLLFEAIGRAGLDARVLAGAKVAVIGPATAEALAAHGVRADITAERFVAEGLVEALAGEDLEGRKLLLARAAGGRRVIADAVSERGGLVDEVVLYSTVAEQPDAEVIEMAAGADFLTFASSSSVTNFLGAMDGRIPSGAKVVSIGPATSATLRANGIEPDAEANPHNLEGLIQALLSLHP